MKRLLAGLAPFSLAGVLHAARDFGPQETLRASLLVKGTITVSDTGVVTGYTPNQPGGTLQILGRGLHRIDPHKG